MNRPVERINTEGWHLPLPFGMPYNSTSVAYEASRKAASGPCRLFGLEGYNSGAAQFILIIDDEELPGNGALPGPIIPVAATSVFSAYFGSVGRWFSRGIIVANSSTGPTLTIGAADCWFDVQYI